MLLFLYHTMYFRGGTHAWKDDGREKTLTVQVTEQILSWNPRGKLIKREPGTYSAEKLVANSRQNLCCRYWGFWRAPQETPGKEIWRQKETNAMTTAGTNSPRCRVRHCRLMIKKK